LENTAISIRELRFAYPGGPEVLLIDHWDVPAGSATFLRGPSGSGKSTLLHLICGLLTAGSGRIRVCGESVSELGPQARDRFRARHIGLVFQQFNLLPYLSVGDNLALALRFSRAAEPLKPALLLERLRLPSALLTQQAGQLSVGQQQRVAIARALIHRPQVLIADEPSSALDADARDAFINLLLELAQEDNTTVLFVSHDAALAAHFDHTADLRDLNRATTERNRHAA
jgi:putative ABC transport system ATP-binding protein